LSDTYFDHLYNGIIVSLDGKWVYINGGSRTDHGEVEDNAGAFPDTRDVALTARILAFPPAPPNWFCRMTRKLWLHRD